MKQGVLVVALAGWLGACAIRQAVAPVPEQVDPSASVEGTAQPISITGHDFWLNARVDFNASGDSQLSSTFRAWLGDVELEQVQWLNDTSLTALVPASVPLGVWDLIVEDPAGRRGTLAAAFIVTPGSGSGFYLSAEDAPAGSGQAVFDVGLAVGTPRTLYAVVRGADGGYVSDVVATWTLQGIAGTQVPATGTSSTLTLTDAGSGTLTVAATPLPSISLTVHDLGSCPVCADSCHSTGICQTGTCVFGAADKDSDLDLAIDATCGGTDCNDDAGTARPGLPEGPFGNLSCTDGLDNDCNGQIDAADSKCVVNTAPRAGLSITPTVNPPNGIFSASAASSTDAQDGPAALSYAWDWTSDGTTDSTSSAATFSYPAAGIYTVALTVTDTGGLISRAAFIVSVAAAADIGTVTTGADENNAGATPACPGGAPPCVTTPGFSLREAITWSSATAGTQTIVVPAGTVVMPTAALPDLAAGGATVIVADGAILDNSMIGGAGASCLVLRGNGDRVLGLEITNCGGWAIEVAGTNAVMSRNKIHDGSFGIDMAGNSNTVGPNNELYANLSFGVQLNNPNNVIDNLIRDHVGLPGIIARGTSDTSRIIGNVLRGNGVGIDFRSNADDLVVWNNTVHGQTGDGVVMAASASGTDMRNNVFSNNGGWGLNAGSGNFATLDFDDFYGNASGHCSQCVGLGPNSKTVDPLYVSPGTYDLRLVPYSPLIDVGANTGTDRNGAGAGLFDGAAADLGALECR